MLEVKEAYPLNPFSSNRAHRSFSLLLGPLEYVLSTREFDNPVLVGLGGITMPGAVN